MAKAKRWEDVRLLSFDLQTVEFSYASVRITASSFARSIPIFLRRTTRSPSRARTNSSRAVRTTSTSGVSHPKTRPTTTAQTHTQKRSPSSTRSCAKAASPMPSRHSSPSCVIPCRYLRSWRASQHGRCPRPPAGGA